MHFFRNFSASVLFLSVFFLSAPLVSAVSYQSTNDQGVILANAVQTEHFDIEFSDLVKDQADVNRNGVNDIVDIVAEALELSLRAYVDDLGYDDPTLDGKIRVLLDDKGEYLLDGSIGTTGFLSDDQLFLAVDPFLNEGYLKITSAHELFHVFQFKMDDDFAQTYQGVDWAESTAVWVEEYMYDDNNDYINYLPDFFDYTDYSIFATSVPAETLYPYALTIWPHFLTEFYDSPDIIRDIWESYTEDGNGYEVDTKLYEATDAAVQNRGDDLAELFQTFTLWNADAADKYEEGANFPELTAALGSSDGEYHQSVDAQAPASYGTNYLSFENPGETSFQFHFIRPEGVRFAVSLVPVQGGNPDILRAKRWILEADDSLEKALELNGLSSNQDVLVVLSPLESSTAKDSGDFFDIGYQYLYAARFGQDLFIKDGAEDSTTDTEKSGTDEPVFDDVRPVDSLRLQVTTYDANSVSFSWNRLPGAQVDHYVLEYGLKSGEYTQEKKIATPHTIFAHIEGLQTGKAYYFQVSAFDETDALIAEPSTEISITPQEWLFEDLSYTDTHYHAISALVEKGIFQGYEDGSFRSNDSINRAELLKILVEGQGITPNSDAFNSCFKDVNREWFAPYVCYAKSEGWVQGYADGRFNPAQTVSKVEALKMLLEAYGYNLEEGSWVSSLKFPDLGTQEWYSIYVWKAASLGLLEEVPGQNFAPSQGRTRGAMAEELYRLLVQLKKI